MSNASFDPRYQSSQAEFVSQLAASLVADVAAIDVQTNDAEFAALFGEPCDHAAERASKIEQAAAKAEKLAEAIRLV